MPRKIEVTQEHLEDGANILPAGGWAALMGKKYLYWESAISAIGLALLYALEEESDRYDFPRLKYSPKNLRTYTCSTEISQNISSSEDIYYVKRLNVSFNVKIKNKLPQPFNVIIRGLPGRIYAKKN